MVALARSRRELYGGGEVRPRPQNNGSPRRVPRLIRAWIAARAAHARNDGDHFATSQPVIASRGCATSPHPAKRCNANDPHPEEPRSGVSKDEGFQSAQKNPYGSRRGFAAPHHEGFYYTCARPRKYRRSLQARPRARAFARPRKIKARGSYAPDGWHQSGRSHLATASLELMQYRASTAPSSSRQ